MSAVITNPNVSFNRAALRCVIPPHNAWVVGNEPVVAIGIEGVTDFAKK